MEVAYNPQIGELEDGGVGVFVDGDDGVGGLHADLVLDFARDADRYVKLGAHRLARLAYLVGVWYPAHINHSTSGTNSTIQALGKLMHQAELLGAAQAAAACDNCLRTGEVGHPTLLCHALNDRHTGSGVGGHRHFLYVSLPALLLLGSDRAGSHNHQTRLLAFAGELAAHPQRAVESWGDRCQLAALSR